MSFDFETVKDILVCPQSLAPLVLDNGWLVSTDAGTRLAYPIVDEIPCLLSDEAEELSLDDWSTIMQRTGFDPATGKPAVGE